MPTRSPSLRQLAPVLAGFFIMGFCDMVAPVTARIAAEYPPSQQTAVHFLPSMVFLWFLLLAAPVAAWMERAGRKRVALAGYALTVVGLAVPFAAGRGCDLVWYFVGFGLLGIGNTVLQVAVNPMLACLVPPERMSGYLTVGQIFRNCSLLLVAPLVTLAAARFGAWNLLLPLYAALTLVGALWMQAVPIPERCAEPGGSAGGAPCGAKERPAAAAKPAHGAVPAGGAKADADASPASRSKGPEAAPGATSASGALGAFRLLRLPLVRLGVLGVVFFIMADVGNGFLSARLIDDPSSLFTSAGYYACRIVGTIVGAWALQRFSERRYLRWNLAAAMLLAAGLTVVRSEAAVYLFMGLLGFTFACLFPSFYAVATTGAGERANGAAGLLIMAISAGALSGPLCGALTRLAGAHAAMLFVLACLAGMYLVASRIPEPLPDAPAEFTAVLEYQHRTEPLSGLRSDGPAGFRGRCPGPPDRNQCNDPKKE